jgi:ParB family chromosome partitioning protein
MNAPASAAALANPTITMLALNVLKPSQTHIQELRRSRFDTKLIDELAESIKGVGVLQAILVRPLGVGYEIVAGERRMLGAKKAGLKEIPATVRELNDEQVLEVQLIENLQREGLHELEEAEGYEELMKLKKISADAVADMVGRSRSYVFKRTKLLALCPRRARRSTPARSTRRPPSSSPGSRAPTCRSAR